jgi:hypothetical protein
MAQCATGAPSFQRCRRHDDLFFVGPTGARVAQLTLVLQAKKNAPQSGAFLMPEHAN